MQIELQVFGLYLAIQLAKRMSSSLALIAFNAAFREGRGGERQREVREDVWRMTEGGGGNGRRGEGGGCRAQVDMERAVHMTVIATEMQRGTRAHTHTHTHNIILGNCTRQLFRWSRLG